MRAARLLLALAMWLALGLAPMAAARQPGLVRLRAVIDGKAETRLRWAPPALVNPITRRVSGTPAVQSLAANQDYIIICDTPITGELTILNGRNIVLIGCTINGRLNAKFFSGVFHAEGLLIRPPVNTDGVGWGATGTPTGVMRLQNVRMEGLQGCNNTGAGCNHSDCFQPHGDVAGIQVDRLTCYNNYQGFIVAPQGARGFSDIRRFNYVDAGPANSDGGNPSTGAWFSDTDQSGGTGQKPYFIACFHCYVRPRVASQFWYKGTYPFPRTAFSVGGTAIRVIENADGSVCYGQPLQIRGIVARDGTCRVIIPGDPPGGDFVPLSVVTNYVSPGYMGPSRLTP
ncbi:MAG: hypothetical protein K2X76_16295 [Sphingomonas sp.]|nr:hypothetical protein [Sphingomonas sp.]